MEQEFFKKSEYDLIGVEFNYDLLAKNTSPEFADEVKNHTYYSLFSYIKKYHRKGNFHYFYTENMEQTAYKLITAYCNDKGDYFDVDTISSVVLGEMGLKVVKEDAEVIKNEN